MTKADLKNYRMLALECQRLKAQLEALESSLFSPKSQRYSTTPRGSGSGGRTLEDAVAGHLALRDHYEAQLAKKEAEQLAIEQAIESLEDPAERMVIRERYVNGLSWVQVCMIMQPKGYSERQVYRLHGFALLKMKEV